MWTLEFYVDENGAEPFREWLENDLTTLQHAALTSALRLVLATRGIDVCASEWGKALGAGLFEFRVRHTAAEIETMFGGTTLSGKAGERILLRVFFHVYGTKIVLLLGGYDKGADTTERRQQREMAAARKRLKDFIARQRARPRSPKRKR